MGFISFSGGPFLAQSDQLQEFSISCDYYFTSYFKCWFNWLRNYINCRRNIRICSSKWILTYLWYGNCMETKRIIFRKLKIDKGSKFSIICNPRNVIFSPSKNRCLQSIFVYMIWSNFLKLYFGMKNILGFFLEYTRSR